MKKRFLFVASCLLAALRAEPEATAVVTEAPQFIRVEERDAATELQTAVVKFTKGDAEVELVGAIHIADLKYYEALNQRFEGYQAVLYEGIGGGRMEAPVADKEAQDVAPKDAAPTEESKAEPEDRPRTLEERVADLEDYLEKTTGDAAAEDAAKPKANLDGLHGAYDAGAKWLGLSYQMKEIDYRKANFVHADLSLEEFATLQAERKENIVGFMLKAGLQAKKKPVKEPNSFRLLTSIIKGNKNGLKRELVHTLGAGDDQVSGLAGENVIIGDRNAKCLEVLDREVAAGKRKLCIFYGAAHFPDMEKRMLQSGWTKAGTEWMTAWDIGR
jgi:hypothetical protein